MKKLSANNVQWVTNEMAELGVKIGDQFFFLYKGESLKNSGDFYRPVGKREFGECCHPWQALKDERLPECYVGYHDGLDEQGLWKSQRTDEKICIPAQMATKHNKELSTTKENKSCRKIGKRVKS